MLALVAGGGWLPGYIAARLGRNALKIAALDGFPPEGLEPDHVFRVETLGSFLAWLREAGVTRVCFAGPVRRPPLDPAAVDAATQPLVPRLVAAIRSSDDAALREVIAIFEEAGMAVVAAHDLVPDVLPAPGVPTRRKPGAEAEMDAVRGQQVLARMGDADVGQSCIVRRGQVLTLEGLFGTDWMLDSLARRPDGAGGLLYKGPKPGQDRRIDLPAIGPETVRRAAAGGLDGIVIEAGGVMVLGDADLAGLADAAGLFLWVREA